MSSIYYCEKCKKYTLEENCNKCNNKTISNKPAKFSIEDKWGFYRRCSKLQNLKKE